MSSSEQKSEPIAAICAPPTTPEAPPPVTQPRQPTNLHGLLKYSAEAASTGSTTSENNFQPLDEARKKFLEQALQSLTVDIIEMLLAQIKLLEKVDELEESSDAAKYVSALQTISEYVCEIDTANDFHKIGGFVIMQPCLTCGNHKVREETCHLLAELCQNNPYCQRVVLENGLLPLLIHIVESDTDVPTIVKALYAISCIVRQNSSGCTQFIQYKGVQTFLNALHRDEDKINTKICFFLRSLCNSQPDFRSRLVFVGYIPVLVSLISNQPKSSDEHVLALLLKLLEDNPAAASECKQNSLNTKGLLENYLKAVAGKEEYLTEEEYCTTIYNILFE